MADTLRLSEEALKKDPTQVFDLLDKLGEGFVIMMMGFN